MFGVENKGFEKVDRLLSVVAALLFTSTNKGF
jgi:hypothetical protein